MSTDQGVAAHRVRPVIEPVLIGYFPKRSTPAPNCDGEREICSVSECVAPGPEGWARAWRHNDWGFFDSAATAWSVVPETERAAFELYAYCLYPVEFVGGERRSFPIGNPNVAPLTEGFERLGYDVVSRGSSDFFECSPLSCNYWANEVGANEHCLVTGLDEAFRLASVAEASGCEPGDYFVIEVWRESTGNADS